jgi:hypothetical protein
VGFYRHENSYGHIHAAAIFRSVGGFVPHTIIPDLKEHRNGYGMSVSGAWRLGRSRDNVVFQGIGGRGIANYYNDNYGLGSDVGFDANGRLVATPTWSGTFGYQHYWTKIVRSTVSYGRLQINNTAGIRTNYHASNYASGNVIIQPSALYLFGAEYIYASLRRKDDFLWVAPRFQATCSSSSTGNRSVGASDFGVEPGLDEQASALCNGARKRTGRSAGKSQTLVGGG